MSSHRSLLLVLLSFFSLTLFQVAVPVRLVSLNASPLFLGLLLAIPGIVGLITDAPLAHVSDQIGRRPMVTFGALLLVCSSLLLAVSTTIALMVIAVIFYGFANSAQATAMLVSVTEAVPVHRSASIQGWNGSVQRLGALGGSLVVLATNGARLMFVMMALAGGCSVGASAGRRGGRKAWPRRSMFASYAKGWQLLRKGGLVEVSTVANLLLMLLFITTNSFLPLVFTGAVGLLPLGLLLACRDATSVIFSPLFGVISKRFGWGRCLVCSMAVGAAGLQLCGILSTTSPWLYTALAMTGLSIGFGVAGTNHAITLGTTPNQRALGLVATGYAGRVGSFVMPVALSAVFVHGGRLWLFHIATLLAVVMTGRVVFVLRKTNAGRQPSHSAAIAPIQ